MPEVWNRRAKQAQTLVPPALAYQEQAQLADAAKDFYAIGVRRLLPASLRRRLIAREALARLPAKKAPGQSP